MKGSKKFTIVISFLFHFWGPAQKYKQKNELSASRTDNACGSTPAAAAPLCAETGPLGSHVRTYVSAAKGRRRDRGECLFIHVCRSTVVPVLASTAQRGGRGDRTARSPPRLLCTAGHITQTYMIIMRAAAVETINWEPNRQRRGALTAISLIECPCS